MGWLTVAARRRRRKRRRKRRRWRRRRNRRRMRKRRRRKIRMEGCHCAVYLQSLALFYQTEGTIGSEEGTH